MAKELENPTGDVEPDAAKEVADKAAEAAKETEAGKAGKADEAEQPQRDASVAGEMATLTHEQVRESAPFKGVVNELRELREKNKQLTDDAAVAAGTTPATAGADDDEDVFTRGDVKRIVAESNANLREEMRSERRSEIAQGNTAVRVERIQHGLDSLRADQLAGKIPMGVSTDALWKQAVVAMKESDPDILQSLMGKPNAVRKIWNYAKATMPEIAEALGKAGTVETTAEKERIALGGSPEGAEAPTDVKSFAEALDKGAG